MRTLTILLFLTALSFFYSCDDQPEPVVAQQDSVITELNRGCPNSSYEVLANGDTVNKSYGNEKIKEGHWITFVLINRNPNDKKIEKCRMEEGYYKNNKKTGFWILYNRDGSVRDSVEYRDDVLVETLEKR